MAEIKFEIVENLGVIGTSTKNWTKEINLVSWNGRKAKIDIRDWDENHEKMGKGIILSKEELKALKDILDTIDIDDLDM